MGGGEASCATSDDEKLFREVCIAMTVSKEMLREKLKSLYCSP